jgi:hypothetical protein
MTRRAHSRGDVWRRRAKLYSGDLFVDTVFPEFLRQIGKLFSVVYLISVV